MPLFAGSPEKKVGAKTDPDIDNEDEVDDGNRNILLSLISQLRPGSDLSRITLPTFILERKSMLERITNTMQHPKELIVAHDTDDEVQRFVEVIRWYMSGWHIGPKAVKKPLNPVLGEYFTCWWDLEDSSRAYYIAEQTSHHPPQSSYFYCIPAHNIRIDGLMQPHSKFLGNSAASIMEGVGFVTFTDHNESYELTQPNVYVRNVLVGSLRMEMGDRARVICKETGLEAEIEFRCKGYFTGSYNVITGKIYRLNEGKKKVLYELSGKWSEAMYITNAKTGEKSVLFDVSNDIPEKPEVRPLDEQGKYESRRLWKVVTDALGRHDHDTATAEKFNIEDEQRIFKKNRQDANETFWPKLFKRTDDSVQYRICVDDQLKAASSPKDVEQILQSVVPILPGATFPSGFERSGEQKSHDAPKHRPTVASKRDSIVYEGDKFVDANQNF